MAPDPDLSFTLTPAQLKSRRSRNTAIGLLVGGLALVFYVITIAKLGSHVFTAFGP